MPVNADIVSTQAEKLRPKLGEMFETSNFLLSEIKPNAEVEVVSTRDYRIPVLVSFGGDYGKFDPDGGDMGRGSGPLAKHYVTSYFSVRHAIELSNLQMYATAKSEQAVKKTYALAVANAMRTFQAMEDASLHTAGNGIVFTATAHTTSGGKSVYTGDTAVATQLLRRQQKVIVYDSGLSAPRDSGAAFRCEAITPTQVTLNATVTSAAATDVFVFDGLSGASPTWKKGIPTFINTLTTGNLMSLSRSDYPEIHSNWVNANGALSGVHGMLLLDQIEQRRDDVEVTAVFHMKQRTAWYKAGMAISEWQRGKNDGPLDLVPKRKKEFQYAGLRAITDKHGDRTKVYFLRFPNWGRAVLKDLDWYTLPGTSQKVFQLYGTSGGVAAGILMYLEMHSDWYTDDPGNQGVIYGLSIPTA